MGLPSLSCRTRPASNSYDSADETENCYHEFKDADEALRGNRHTFYAPAQRPELGPLQLWRATASQEARRCTPAVPQFLSFSYIRQRLQQQSPRCSPRSGQSQNGLKCSNLAIADEKQTTTSAKAHAQQPDGIPPGPPAPSPLCRARTDTSSEAQHVNGSEPRSWSDVDDPRQLKRSVTYAFEPRIVRIINLKDVTLGAYRKTLSTISEAPPEAKHCFGLWGARLACSWFFKMLLLQVFLYGIFLVGPLSRPMWIPISFDSACQRCDDKGGCPVRIDAQSPMDGLESCKELCESTFGCNAVDWYNATRWCTLYPEGCTHPIDQRDKASSFQTAVTCQLANGTHGVLIAGHCHTGLEVPTAWSIASHEIPILLTSWRSWSISIGVAFFYAYFMSQWFRDKTRPAVKRVGSWVKPVLSTGNRLLCCGGIYGRLVTLAILVPVWLFFTHQEWGLERLPRTRMQAVTEPVSETGWLGASVFVLMLVLFKGCRACVASIVVTIGGWLMSIFTSIAAAALSLCFDVGGMTAAGLAAAGGGAAAAADGAVAAEGAAAMEAGVGADAAIAGADAAIAGADGMVGAEGIAGGSGAAEAAMAADAAIAADTAAAAEAAAAAEGVVGAAAILSFCVVQ